MREPRTPRQSGVKLKFEGSKGPRTPSANRLASQQQQTRLAERGETAPAAAPFSQSARAWRTGADRKIMFDNRGGHALIPEAKRSVSLVLILNICSWLLLATGMFQVVMAKLSDFKWPLHWVGVLMMFLGLVTMGVRIFTNRCGTSPRWAGAIAVVTVLACLTAWLAFDGPLYKKIKAAKTCNDEDLRNLCPGHDCVCQVASGAWDLCVDFEGDCEYVTSNRRYLIMSIISLWVGMGLSFVVAVVIVRVVRTTHDAGAIARAEERRKVKAKVAPVVDGQTVAPASGV